MGFLVDTSALVRIESDDALRLAWQEVIAEGDCYSCAPQRTEYLYSARSFADYEFRSNALIEVYPDAPVPKRVWHWVSSVQFQMAKRGEHRSAGVVDLLIAATAAHHGLTVVHDDRDFVAIAAAAADLSEMKVHAAL